MRRPSVLSALCLVALVLAAGAGSAAAAAPAAKGTYVGRVAGSRAYIAVVSDGRRVAGYLCDGRGLAVWLAAGRLSGGSAALVTTGHERLGRVRLDGARASGRVTIAGAAHAFRAVLAHRRAGLYRAVHGKPRRKGSSVTGWIVLGDGSIRGGSITFPDIEFARPAPPHPSGRPVGAGFIDPNVGL